MSSKKVHDKEIEIYIPNSKIRGTMSEMAEKINQDLAGEDVIFLGILNGVFMFASDLIREITLDYQITFLKLASYAGTSSTGTVKRLIGINEDIHIKTLVTGNIGMESAKMQDGADWVEDQKPDWNLPYPELRKNLEQVLEVSVNKLKDIHQKNTENR